MAGITQVNPVKATGTSNRSRSYLGKSIMAFNIDYAVNGTNFDSTENGPTGAHQLVLEIIQKTHNIVGLSALRSDGSNDGQVYTILVEGDFGTDTYDGSNSETLAAFLQTEIRAQTSIGVGSVNLSSATVAAVDGFPMFAHEG